jgi:hypothetical protein
MEAHENGISQIAGCFDAGLPEGFVGSRLEQEKRQASVGAKSHIENARSSAVALD